MTPKNEDGYIAVETVGAFVPFLLLVISILSLVNIVAVQARVHYALTQAANTLSMYSYTLELIGVANNLTTLENKAHRVESEAASIKNDIGTVLTCLNFLSGSSDTASGNGDGPGNTSTSGGDLNIEPQEVLQLLMNYSLNELRNVVFEALARPLIGRYLANGDMTGDEYLKSVGVVRTDGSRGVSAEGLAALQFHEWSGLGLGNSVMIDRNGNVILTVHYEVEYTFGGLKLPFTPTLRITQTAVTKAWLNGSGKGYW